MAPAETLTVSTQRHGVSMRSSAPPSRAKKPWHSRVPFASSSSSAARQQQQREDRLTRESSRQTGRSASQKKAWWRTRLFAGMYNDVRRRAPFYWSDWKDAWDYRVVPATVYMYFAKYVCNANAVQCPMSPTLS